MGEITKQRGLIISPADVRLAGFSDGKLQLCPVEVKSRPVHLIFSPTLALSQPTTMSYSWGIIIFAALFGITSAAPSLLPRQAATTQLTFTGAGASFSVTAPVDGSAVSLSKLCLLIQLTAIKTLLTCSHNRQHPGRRLHRPSRDCELFIRGRRWSEAHRAWSQFRRHHRTASNDRACELPIDACRVLYLERLYLFMVYETCNSERQAVKLICTIPNSKATIVHNILV